MRHILLLSLSLFVMASARGQESAFRVKPEANQVAADQAFQITFKLDGKGRDFNPPSFKYFDVVWGPAKSINRRIVNGNFSMTMSYSYKLKPKRQGSYRIGPATIVKEGETLTTEAVSIEVSKAKRSDEEQRSGRDQSVAEKIQDNLYIKCMVDNSHPFRGEQIRAVYKLFINVGVSDYEVKATPQFNGFWKEMIKDPEKFNVKTERVNGERFKTAVLSKVALFPQRTGELTLDPFKMKFNVRYRAGSDDEGIFSRFRRNYKTKTLTISSTPRAIHVKPLPDQAPSSFSGLVGNFNLSSSLERNQTQLNKPVSLKLTITGQGNFNKVQPPELRIPSSFDTYEPEVDNRVSARSGVVKGAKTFEYLLLPRAPGKQELKPVRLTYFNPQQEAYVTEKTPAYQLRVRPGQGGPDSTIAARKLLPEQKAVQPLDQDIRYIQAKADDLSQEPAGFVFSAPFWGLTLAPFLLIGSVVYLQRQSAPAVASRSQKAQKMARRQLKTAAAALKQQETEHFNTALSWALWGFTADKLDMPVAEMTQDRVKQRLTEKSIPQPLVDEWLTLIQLCEEAAYMPGGGPKNQQELYQRAEKLITQLEAEFSSA